MAPRGRKARKRDSKAKPRRRASHREAADLGVAASLVGRLRRAKAETPDAKAMSHRSGNLKAQGPQASGAPALK